MLFGPPGPQAQRTDSSNGPARPAPPCRRTSALQRTPCPPSRAVHRPPLGIGPARPGPARASTQEDGGARGSESAGRSQTPRPAGQCGEHGPTRPGRLSARCRAAESRRWAAAVKRLGWYDSERRGAGLAGALLRGAGHIVRGADTGSLRTRAARCGSQTVARTRGPGARLRTGGAGGARPPAGGSLDPRPRPLQGKRVGVTEGGSGHGGIG